MDAILLSPRETTVLHFVAWGYTNKEIAGHLSLSVKTVESHKANGMRKLSVPRRSGLVRYAVDSGWLTSAAAPAVTTVIPNSRG
jgi:DNA-binding NarL/FixJ family response regulator